MKQAAALADTSVVYECASGTFSFDETGTPIKTGVLMGYSYDEASNSVVKTAERKLLLSSPYHIYFKRREAYEYLFTVCYYRS